MFVFKIETKKVILLIIGSLLIGLLLFFAFNIIKIENYEIKELIDLKDSSIIDNKERNTISKKPLLIIFFSVDCRMCYEPIVKANLFYDKIINKMEILGVSRDEMERIKYFRVKYDIKFPLIYDKFAKYHKKFQVKVIPQRVLIKENRIIYKDDPYKNFSERDIEFNKILKKLL